MIIKKKQFNKLLGRYKNGVAYMDNKNIDLQERLEWEVSFQQILDGLARLVNEIGNVSKEEMDHGFKI